ncbi:MAG TPA: carboxypeptidase-like regulatory domain-containing protein [Puia sp.]|nr:carboxypeptidase-like regulatory domain-containing protein [Puia sp.]
MDCFLPKVLLLATALFILEASQHVFSQVTIRGTVYNMNRTKPLEAVSVVSTSGRGVVTDSNGNYAITVREEDSISFSYLGRYTMKYPVSMISLYNNFDVALHVEATELRQVQVAPRNYHMDSLQNRQDYAKIFNYKKPGIKVSEPGVGSTGVGLDLDEIINIFRFNRNRRMLAFQRRLVQEEQDNFVDHRFTKLLVKKITHMGSPELDSFMVKYKPSYNFTKTSTDYEFDSYIKLAAREYRALKNRAAGEMKKEKLPF